MVGRVVRGRRAWGGIAAALLLGVTVGPTVAHTVAPAATGRAASADGCALLAPEGRPLRVLFYGDSMTQGRSGSATYRYWTWRGLAARGVDVRFVGPRVNPNRIPTGLTARESYLRTSHGFGRNLAHAGRGGRTFATHPDRPADLVRDHEPDVIVLQMGYNDANYESAQEIARRTVAFVREVWRTDLGLGEERTRFVLGQIPLAGISRFRPLAEKNAITASINARVARRLAEPCVVEVNRMRDARDPAWQPTTHTYDGTHPNAVGETLMAQRMLDGLRRLGVYREPVRTFRPALTWDPRPAVAAERTRTGHDRWRLHWASEQWRVGGDTVRLRIAPVGRPARLTGWLSGSQTVRRLTPGTRVQLVASRGGRPGRRMVSEPGPAFRVPSRD